MPALGQPVGTEGWRPFQTKRDRGCFKGGPGPHGLVCEARLQPRPWLFPVPRPAPPNG